MNSFSGLFSCVSTNLMEIFVGNPLFLKVRIECPQLKNYGFLHSFDVTRHNFACPTRYVENA